MRNSGLTAFKRSKELILVGGAYSQEASHSHIPKYRNIFAQFSLQNQKPKSENEIKVAKLRFEVAIRKRKRNFKV